MKVLDFGISRDSVEANVRLTKTESIMGTPLYMAPEQFRSTKGVDARADVWALGATLYETLAGRAPFENTEGHVAVAIVSDPVPPIRELRPDVPPALIAVLDRALAKNRDDRFATAGELAEALLPFATSISPPSSSRVSFRESLSARPEAHTEAVGAVLRGSLPRSPRAGTALSARASSKVPSTDGALSLPPSAPRGSSRARQAAGAALFLALAAVVGSFLVWRGFAVPPAPAPALALAKEPRAPAAAMVASSSATIMPLLPSSSPAPVVSSSPGASSPLPGSTYSAASAPRPPLAKRPGTTVPPTATPTVKPPAPAAATAPPLFFPAGH